MTSCNLRKVTLFLELFVAIAHCALPLNYSGTAVATRFWDCCKPSCAWDGKASFNQPVRSCFADNKTAPISAGSACGPGGTSYSCDDQQPWAVNDTLAYGFAGAWIMPELVGKNAIEGAWCCACYQLDFTSDPLRGKTLILQATNVAFDIQSTNRFSLAVPGGNITSQNACAQQFGVQQSVFGQENVGVSKKEDCDNLPDALKAGCRWRFDWFKDASFPTANFKRVVCPAVLSNRTGCMRTDDRVLSGDVPAAGSLLTPSSSTAAVFAALLLSVLSI